MVSLDLSMSFKEIGEKSAGRNHLISLKLHANSDNRGSKLLIVFSS